MPRPVCEISIDLIRSQNVEESDFKFDSKTSKLVQSWTWLWSASGRGDTGACIWHSSCSNNIFTFFIEFSLFILVCHWPSNMKRENFKKSEVNGQPSAGLWYFSSIIHSIDVGWNRQSQKMTETWGWKSQIFFTQKMRICSSSFQNSLHKWVCSG